VREGLTLPPAEPKAMEWAVAALSPGVVLEDEAREVAMPGAPAPAEKPPGPAVRLEPWTGVGRLLVVAVAWTEVLAERLM
jgi:hypothetical protein